MPKVTAHGMRGVARHTGGAQWNTGARVASALGQASFRTTAESYAKREAVGGAQQKRALAVLIGWRLAP